MAEQPVWTDVLTKALLGSRIIIGLTLRNHDDPPDAPGELFQMHGLVDGVDPQVGVRVALQGVRAGQIHHLPPDPGAFERAAPGDYRLRTTGEVIVDPDYMTVWSMTRAPKDEADGDQG